MRLESINIRQFKRFNDLTIEGLEPGVKLVMLTGPNGSGKTSVFEAFNYWISCVNQCPDIDPEYHIRTNNIEFTTHDWQGVWNSIVPKFHGAVTFALNTSHREKPDQTRKAFYIRSAYRHEADFTTDVLRKTEEVLSNSNRPSRLIYGEARVSENYQRLAAESYDALYDPTQKTRASKPLYRTIAE